MVKSGESNKIMLIGTFTNNLGDKNRIALPKKFSSELGGKIIVTKGYDNCLIIVDVARWEKLIKSFESVAFVNSDIRDTRRFLIGSATEVETDKQGRFILPENLKMYSELKKTGVFLGLLDYVELWDSEVWTNKENEINKNAADVAQKVSQILQK